MSKTKRQSFDVFLAHDPSDNALATAVIDRLGAAGVSAFSMYLSEPEPLDPLAAEIRRELQDSFSFVVLLTPAFAASETLPFLVGAAAMARAPVFVLTGDALPEKVSYLGAHPAFPLWNGIDELIRNVRKTSAPFSPERVDALRKAFARVGASADEVLVRPTLRAEFAAEFRAISGQDISEERLLRELMRLRKQGKLPRRTATAAG